MKLPKAHPNCVKHLVPLFLLLPLVQFFTPFVTRQSLFLLDTCQPFDLVAFDVGAELWIAPYKILMIISIALRSITDSLEVVKIQLSLKRRKGTHVEIFGHDIFCPFFRFVYSEPEMQNKCREERWG